MPFCLGHLPGQHKRLCIALSTFSLHHLQAVGQTSLNEESAFSLSLSLSLSLSFSLSLFLSLSLSYPGRFQQQTEGHLNTREHTQHLITVSFGDHSFTFYSFLLKSTRPLAECLIPALSFTTIYFFLRLTAQGFKLPLKHC